MNIKVEKIDSKLFTAITGGECGELSLTITVDEGLPKILKQENVIHCVIENYFPSLDHSKIEELTDLIINGLDQLDELDT
jgi:hypothetical protein